MRGVSEKLPPAFPPLALKKSVAATFRNSNGVSALDINRTSAGGETIRQLDVASVSTLTATAEDWIRRCCL